MTHNKDRVNGITSMVWTFRYNGFDHFAKTYPVLLARFESLVAPTLTLPHEPPAEEPLTVLCACGAELSIDETMQDEDGGLGVKVRPHDCAAYSHAATRRVCDRLAVLLNEHFDATGD